MMPFCKRLALLIFIAVVIYFSLYEHVPEQSAPARFVKIDRFGELVDNWHGPWACIYDSKTGLVWENKSDDESIHDALWTYSWQQQQYGVENGGDCYFELDRCDTADLIRRANNEASCGIDQWRLPSAVELRSIVNPSPKAGQASIYNDFFPHTKRGDYWSSEHERVLTGVYKHLGHGAVAIDFISGEQRVIPYRNAAFVRLVSRPDKKLTRKLEQALKAKQR
ncbi:DUF1566 domain-containing protein [Agaribacterium haliotis]|uniref:Lcl C-terminal domain-containing protein n=1 Tax=Agaribacterium haliotis TaxID=2013869 RepID=UPI000BB56442|nr:DUF1566 domain-containing protein [Agaribacterium haliotis]